MAVLKVGGRLKSSTCEGEVMVVVAPSGETSLTCGGEPMVDSTVDSAEVARTEPHPDHAVGIAIGKRYVTEAEDVELLCVKAGARSLAVSGSLMLLKDTKQLPKTD